MLIAVLAVQQFEGQPELCTLHGWLLGLLKCGVTVIFTSFSWVTGGFANLLRIEVGVGNVRVMLARLKRRVLCRLRRVIAEQV